MSEQMGHERRRRNERLEKVSTLWERILGVPSTARDAEDYRQALFRDYGTTQEMLAHLRGKTIVDVGSGLTHKNPYSLINVAAREKDADITFFGVEPRVGGKPGFGILDHLGLIGFKRQSRKRASERRTDTPGENMALAGSLPKLPFPDDSVDIILSRAVVGSWIRDEKTLLETFADFYAVLKVGGEVRINSFFPELFSAESRLGEYIRTHFEYVPVRGSSLVVMKKKLVSDAM